MKLLTLEWIPHAVVKGFENHIENESCNIGPYRAYISRNNGKDSYLKPYELYLNNRTHKQQNTTHATIEEAKQVATQELSTSVHKLCNELGYVLPQTPCTSNT